MAGVSSPHFPSSRQAVQIFGDNAFGFFNYVQSMMLGELTLEGTQGRLFNSLMSRICIENSFCNQSNIFTFLVFQRMIKICGSNTQKLYKITTILLNMCYIFYGNQFTDQLRHALRMSIVALRRSLRANSGLAVVLLHPSNQESMLPLCLLQSAPVLLGLFYDLLCQHQHQHCQEWIKASHNGSKLILCPPDDRMIRESIVPCNFDCCFLGLVNLCRIL